MSRAYCFQCFRPNTACLCGKIKQVHNKPDIIILQHKDEVRHPTGSAIIADLYLQRCIRYVGEDFSCHREFNQILNRNPNNVFLVFPSVNALPLSLFKQKHAVDENTLSQYTFVFIDASWRKAKKIWYLSTNLHQLTAIELDQIKASNYRIRKEPEPGLVSTLESIVNLLSCLEPDSKKYQPLLEIFNEMIDHQIKCMGDEVYQKNYPY